MSFLRRKCCCGPAGCPTADDVCVASGSFNAGAVIECGTAENPSSIVFPEVDFSACVDLRLQTGSSIYASGLKQGGSGTVPASIIPCINDGLAHNTGVPTYYEELCYNPFERTGAWASGQDDCYYMPITTGAAVNGTPVYTGIDDVTNTGDSIPASITQGSGTDPIGSTILEQDTGSPFLDSGTFHEYRQGLRIIREVSLTPILSDTSCQWFRLDYSLVLCFIAFPIYDTGLFDGVAFGGINMTQRTTWSAAVSGASTPIQASGIGFAGGPTEIYDTWSEFTSTANAPVPCQTKYQVDIRDQAADGFIANLPATDQRNEIWDAIVTYQQSNSPLISTPTLDV